MPRYQTKDKLTYTSWRAMRQRCGNSSGAAKYYRDRGITVCERWASFDNFVADMGIRPTQQHTLERINNDGNYEPSNCRWATWVDQALNRRQDGLIEHNKRRTEAAAQRAASGSNKQGRETNR